MSDDVKMSINGRRALVEFSFCITEDEPIFLKEAKRIGIGNVENAKKPYCIFQWWTK